MNLEKVVVCWEVSLLGGALHLGLARGRGQQVLCTRRRATFFTNFDPAFWKYEDSRPPLLRLTYMYFPDFLRLII
jgi:hypothetical protein